MNIKETKNYYKERLVREEGPHECEFVEACELIIELCKEIESLQFQSVYPDHSSNQGI